MATVYTSNARSTGTKGERVDAVASVCAILIHAEAYGLDIVSLVSSGGKFQVTLSGPMPKEEEGALAVTEAKV